jgi:hypothetical protein
MLRVLLLLLPLPLVAQTGQITGLVLDAKGASIPSARVTAVYQSTAEAHAVRSSADGLYALPFLKPGLWDVAIQASGFKDVSRQSVLLGIGQTVRLDFTMEVGSVTESITVSSEAPIVSESPSVSTVVSQAMIERLPLNGRNLQSLVELAPGVLPARTSYNSQGQFSVNGQRPSANYLTIDGVSANIGVSGNLDLGQQAGGALMGVSAVGGTQNLVSIDSVQEFEVQTSTFAPEFGRTPGAQISVATRSGSNDFHGSLFHCFRNDVLDANDWFANRDRLEKPRERFNAFGATASGRFIRDKLFYFGAYEGFRLRQPRVLTQAYPSVALRQSLAPNVRPYFDMLPIPNGRDLGNGLAEFNATFSEPGSLDAGSLRVDSNVSERWKLFGRYSYSPSSTATRSFGSFLAVNVLVPTEITTQTATLGSTWTASARFSNDLRLNWSYATGKTRYVPDTFGGAKLPISESEHFPVSPWSAGDALSSLYFLDGSPGWRYGIYGDNLQRQGNVVSTSSWLTGSHQFKFGVDYRLLKPRAQRARYWLERVWQTPANAARGVLDRVDQYPTGGFLDYRFHNLSLFVQDTWRLTQRLTLTYGVRWDRNPAPDTVPYAYGVRNFSDLSRIEFAPEGSDLYATRN